MEYRGDFIPPFRPETRVHPQQLRGFEERGWVAQAKKNGTCTVVAVPPDRGSLRAWDRRGEPHRAWKGFTAETAAPFTSVRGNGWWVFVAELLHSKVPGVRDTHFVHDCLVADGEDLRRTNYASRLAIMRAALGDRPPGSRTWSHDCYPGNLWVARVVRPGGDYRKLFGSLLDPVDEGLVLKDPNSPGSMVKCRRPTKNYAY